MVSVLHIHLTQAPGDILVGLRVHYGLHCVFCILETHLFKNTLDSS